MVIRHKWGTNDSWSDHCLYGKTNFVGFLPFDSFREFICTSYLSPCCDRIPDVSNTKKDALFGQHVQGAAGKTWWRVQEVPDQVAPTVRELRVVNAGAQLLLLPLYSVGAQPTPWGCHTQDMLAHLNKLV